MQTLNINDVVRYVSVTSVVALICVCLAFSIAVWIKRNRIRVRLSTGLTFGLVAMALFCVVVVALHHEMTSHRGFVEAHDVFTVRSKIDAAATVVAKGGSVSRGDPLVRFEVPGLASRLASLDSRMMAVQEQLQSSDLQPLQLDASIVERRRRLANELAQAQSILIDLQKSSRENHRALLDTQEQYSERLGQLEMQIASNGQLSTISASQLAITQEALGRTQYLRQQGLENISAAENRLTDRLSRELTLKKASSDLAVTERMKTDTEAMRANSVAFLSTMQASLDSQINDQERAIAALRHRMEDAERDEGNDGLRATEARRHSREAMLHEIRGVGDEKSALLATTTIEAPFAGRVIYSNSAPGIVSSNSLLVALAPVSGFTARIRMGNDEVAFLDKARPVVFEFTAPNLLTRFVPGLYKSADPAPLESDQAIVTFDISLPAEMIERLTRTPDPLDVTLMWTAPLWGDPLFLLSVLLLIGALMLVAIPRLAPVKAMGAVAIRAARLLLPLLWWWQPTEAVAGKGTEVTGLRDRFHHQIISSPQQGLLADVTAAGFAPSSLTLSAGPPGTG
jgi:multidrug resistance efflux pump